MIASIRQERQDIGRLPQRERAQMSPMLLRRWVPPGCLQMQEELRSDPHLQQILTLKVKHAICALTLRPVVQDSP